MIIIDGTEKEYTLRGIKQTQSIRGKCLDCDKTFTVGATHPNAIKHAKATGHRVEVNWKFKYNE